MAKIRKVLIGPQLVIITDEKEAETTAKEFWGEFGFAERNSRGLFAVGELAGPFKQIYGSSKKSFDEAFKKAYLHLN